MKLGNLLFIATSAFLGLVFAAPVVLKEGQVPSDKPWAATATTLKRRAEVYYVPLDIDPAADTHSDAGLIAGASVALVMVIFAALLLCYLGRKGLW